MNADIRKNASQINKFAAITKVATYLLPVFMLLVFIEPKNSLFCGPILALLLTYLFLFGSQEFIIAVIIVANDALGTILFNFGSFQYLLIVLVLIKFRFNKLSKIRLIYLAVCLLFLFQLLIVKTIDFRMLIVSFSYVLGIAHINFEDDKSAKKFFQGVAFTVIIIAIHALITGGVDFAEDQMGSLEERRKGILGVGSSDANFSSFLLCAGIVCLWFFCRIRNIVKIILTFPMLYSIVITRSIMGLIGLLIILVCTIMLGKNKLKSMGILLLTIIGLVLLYNIYLGLPQSMHALELDLYIERINEKINQLVSGDIAGATTKRSEIVTVYLKYIFKDQSIWGLLFGWNPQIVTSTSNTVPHNTYLSILLQFGIVGAIIFFSGCIVRFYKTVKTDRNKYYKPYIVLKMLCFFVAFSLSLYEGNMWAIWMLILIVV